jgi:diacylglycerol kinase
VLIHAGCDQWMRDLHQERRAATKEQEALAVDPARDAVGRQYPRVAHTTSVLLRSFRYAFEGVAHIVRTQPNARIELAIGVGAVLLAAWLGLTSVEWAVLVVTIAVVLALEWLNTSLELAVSLASPQRHPSAKAAKDVAAACVLLGAVTSVLVGLILFGPRLMSRLIGT